LTMRKHNARTFRSALAGQIPILIVNMADTAVTAYDALPDRLFVIDKEGRFAYIGGIGPAGVHPKELEPVLERLMGNG